MLPYGRSRELFVSSGQGELTPEERTVRGTFVTGLCHEDIRLLDLFEGDVRASLGDPSSSGFISFIPLQEYTRERISVHPLGPVVPLSSTPVPSGVAHPSGLITATGVYIGPMKAPDLPPIDTLAAPIEADTYIYAGPLTDLSAELWSYEDFVRDNAWKWVGRSAVEDNYAEVDHRREMNGKTLRMETVDEQGERGVLVEV